MTPEQEEMVAGINATLEKLKGAIDRERDHLNSVYSERNMCVALIAQYAVWFGHKVGIKNHVGAEWDDEWRNVLFIDLPAGQVSWHLHESELINFPDIGPYDGEWDGHTTEEKYERVRKFIHLGKSGNQLEVRGE